MNTATVARNDSGNLLLRITSNERPFITITLPVRKIPHQRSLTSVLRQTTAMILAGGQGERLSLLTCDRTKLAVRDDCRSLGTGC
jgi:hypothetical protein